MNASVKVMNSYDYCHFEVSLSAEDVDLDKVDDLRKDAQRLVDKAIKQYKIARQAAAVQPISPDLERKVRAIKENFPQSEWTPEQKATVKEYEDRQYSAALPYDYQDYYELPAEDDCDDDFPF